MRKNVKANLDSADLFICFFLTIISIILRIWCIDHPSKCIFDEIYFGNFTNYYIQNQFFFDIHPPFSKLVMYKIANISEYDASINFQTALDTNYTQPEYVQLRLTPSMFSSLCIPIIYISNRLSSYTKLSSLTSALLLLFDTSLLVEGKYILSDGILHFFVCLHICMISYTFSSVDVINTKSIYHLLNGLTLGFACSSKNTAWGLCVYDAYVYFVSLLPFITNRQYMTFFSKLFSLGITLFLIAIFVYLISFIIHFIILQYGGPGIYYLSDDMQDQLILNSQVKAPIYINRLSGLNIILRSFKLTYIMHTSNMRIKKFHPSQSQPYNWPFLTGHDVGFWEDSDGNRVACRGNLFVYYIGFACLLICLFSVKSNKYIINLRYVIGWCFSYFPFYLIPRTMYLYHYIIPLIFCVSSVGPSLDMLQDYPKMKGFLSVMIAFIGFIGFYLWMPLVYGKYTHRRDVMNWFSSWTSGDSFYQSMLNESLNSTDDSEDFDLFENI